jgi:hypothetical protein
LKRVPHRGAQGGRVRSVNSACVLLEAAAAQAFLAFFVWSAGNGALRQIFVCRLTTRIRFNAEVTDEDTQAASRRPVLVQLLSR